MKNLLILGAGGMGKTIYSIAKGSLGYGKDFRIKGFLDIRNDDWNTEIYPPIIGSEDEYEIQENDVFVCSVGDVFLKKRICEKMKARGAVFFSLIHKNAVIRDNVKIGDGTIVADFAIVGNDAIIGENVLVLVYANIAHDCVVGDYCRIDAHSMLIGGVKIGNSVTVHTASVLSHKVTVGDNSKVGAMSLVLTKVKENTTVWGIPAKKINIE